MSLVALGIAALLGSALPGCNSSARKGDRPPSRRAGASVHPARAAQWETARCRVDKFMRFPALSPSPEDLRCERDADCVVSALVPGSCCDHGCNKRWAYTRVQYRKLRARQGACCNGVKLDCPIWRCPRDPYEHAARCKQHRCVLVNTPAQWTLQKKVQKKGAR